MTLLVKMHQARKPRTLFEPLLLKAIEGKIELTITLRSGIQIHGTPRSLNDLLYLDSPDYGNIPPNKNCDVIVPCQIVHIGARDELPETVDDLLEQS